MNLPKNDFPLTTMAEELGVVSLIEKLIEDGGGQFLDNAWVAYAAVHLRNKSMLDGLTPVGGLDLGRRIFEDILLDFEKELNKKRDKTL